MDAKIPSLRILASTFRGLDHFAVVSLPERNAILFEQSGEDAPHGRGRSWPLQLVFLFWGVIMLQKRYSS